MTFATFRIAARITIAAASLGVFVVAAAAPSRADGNQPPIFVRPEETILIPVPECSKLRPVLFGRCADDDVFAANCGCTE